jgi:hypothetical protein
MAARKVRMGDVLFVDPETPRAVVSVIWTDSVAGEPLAIAFLLDDKTWATADADDELDVSRPMTRHAETGDHDQ